jgi:hypothetical protein
MSRITIKLDRLIVFSKSSLLGCFFACITDIDNQGEVPKGSIIDRDNQANFSLIITDNQAFHGGEGGSGTQKRGPSPSPPDTGGANKKTSTPRTSDRSYKSKTTNLNLAQGKTVDALRTTTSYFEKGWNA